MSKSTPLRLRALRDRINLRGRSELTFEEKVKCIAEVISTFTFNPRDLSYVRDYIKKLTTRHPDLTDDQKVLLAQLEDRFTKREQMIRARTEKKRRGEPISPRKKQEPDAPGVDLVGLWKKEETDGNDNPSTAVDRSQEPAGEIENSV